MSFSVLLFLVSSLLTGLYFYPSTRDSAIGVYNAAKDAFDYYTLATLAALKATLITGDPTFIQTLWGNRQTIVNSFGMDRIVGLATPEGSFIIGILNNICAQLFYFNGDINRV